MSESTAKREVGTPQVKRGMAQMLGGDDVHDDAALEHLCHSTLDLRGTDLTLRCVIAHAHSCSSSWARTSSLSDMFV